MYLIICQTMGDKNVIEFQGEKNCFSRFSSLHSEIDTACSKSVRALNTHSPNNILEIRITQKK